MSLINKEVNDFEVKAFQNDEFKTVKKEDILGKWSVFFFYPADFTFVCPTELEDLSNKYEESIQYLLILILFIKHGMIVQNVFLKLNTLC